MRAAIAIAASLVGAGLALATPAETLDEKFARALARKLAAQPLAQRVLVPSTCARTSGAEYRCEKRTCGQHCQVLRARATVTVGADDHLTVREVKVQRLGDTGECGCCM